MEIAQYKSKFLIVVVVVLLVEWQLLVLCWPLSLSFARVSVNFISKGKCVV